MKKSLWYHIYLISKARMLGHRYTYENRTLFDYLLSTIDSSEITESNIQFLCMVRTDEAGIQAASLNYIQPQEKLKADAVDLSTVVFNAEKFNRNFAIFQGILNRNPVRHV